MENGAVQVRKLVLISFRTFRNFFRSDSIFKILFTVSSEATGFMRSYSKQKFVEESEILNNPMKIFQRATWNRSTCNPEKDNQYGILNLLQHALMILSVHIGSTT